MIHIVLIGMSGAGKSTIGVLLAKSLGYDFLDTDLILQQQEQQLLQEIIDKEGIDKFIEAETRCVLGIHLTNPTVIATGGSVVYSESAMTYLAELGKIIYLEVSFKELSKRLSNIATRGIVKRLEQTLEGVFEERKSLYEKYAHEKLQCDEQSIEEIVTKLHHQLKSGR